jgi:predicted house-cleaning noncanonical NTP pyrophosphatase (MazG superfamily)
MKVKKGWKYLKFEKLIRDGNKKTISVSGGEVEGHNLPKDEFIHQLKLKLVEEANEVLVAKDIDETTDEIGDVLEVLQTLIKQMKIKKRKIRKARKVKAKFRGKFKKGFYCNYVYFPKDVHEKWMDKYEDITNDLIEKFGLED